MNSAIESSLFDFIDELVVGLAGGQVEREDLLEQDSAALTFCEAFFDQFFASLGHNITGFGTKPKAAASELAEYLRRDDEVSTKQVRALIAMYEAFCDMYDDIVGDYGGGSVTYEIFHLDYLSRLLELAQEWAGSAGHGSLKDRIALAYADYTTAIEASAWLTRTRKKESVWRKLILRRRMNS